LFIFRIFFRLRAYKRLAFRSSCGSNDGNNSGVCVLGIFRIPRCWEKKYLQLKMETPDNKNGDSFCEEFHTKNTKEEKITKKSEERRIFYREPHEQSASHRKAMTDTFCIHTAAYIYLSSTLRCINSTFDPPILSVETLKDTVLLSVVN
jgi:hypothetical protein